ncbi:MAG: LemA family protein [Candidatus Bathyarchaeota archaeon]|nr:LemA family protein [Candidatus Bathyarchaeota archaeon]
MNKKILAAVSIIIVVIALVSFTALYITTYNNMVALESTADAQWAQVNTQLQRRYDLIPGVVNASYSYLGYESSVLEEVTRLRTQWMEAEQSGNITEINDATGQLETSVTNFIVTIENYPDLEASSVVQDLMVVLEGTENRISTERMRYNDDVRDYNIVIKAFPGAFFATGWGFNVKPYFEATIGADQPVNIPTYT